MRTVQLVCILISWKPAVLDIRYIALTCHPVAVPLSLELKPSMSHFQPSVHDILTLFSLLCVGRSPACAVHVSR